MIGGASWAILRLITDDPGVWGLHCHIGWHLAMGKVSNIDDWADRQLAAIIVQPKKIASMEQPQEWLAVSRMMGNPLISALHRPRPRRMGPCLIPLLRVFVVTLSKSLQRGGTGRR